MLTPSIGSTDEALRLAALDRYAVLDTPPEDAFDRITALAARRMAAPVAYISIVGADRVWFKSRCGLPLRQIGGGMGLCASAIRSGEPYLLADASTDPDSRSNPLVTNFGLRSYLGVPLTSPDGFNLGALCVMSKDALSVAQIDVDDLSDLAVLVVDRLELQFAERRAVAQSQLMAKEIDHRVMNSLQFVSGLLAMQARDHELGSSASHLQMAASRVAAVAQVHRHFLLDHSTATSCVSFIKRLCCDLENVMGRRIVVSGDDVAVPSAWIQPIGLLVNELVTNAAKHGAGLIEVLFSKRTDKYALSVSDRGPGLPEGFNPKARGAGLGMQVIRSLTEQLGGKMIASARAGGGAVFEVVFPT